MTPANAALTGKKTQEVKACETGEDGNAAHLERVSPTGGRIGLGMRPHRSDSEGPDGDDRVDW